MEDILGIIKLPVAAEHRGQFEFEDLVNLHSIDALNYVQFIIISLM